MGYSDGLGRAERLRGDLAERIKSGSLETSSPKYPVAEQKQRSSVCDQLQIAEKVSLELHETITALEQRFSYVLSGSAPPGNVEDKKPEELCDLAATLRRNNGKTLEAVCRLRDLIGRCEL